MSLEQALADCRVLPVVTPLDVPSTLRLAQALAAAGMRGIEITLRSAAALDCLAAVKRAQPEMLVAAGTVLNPDDLDRAVDAGADACISPGISAALLQTAAGRGVPLVPGVATASEVMLALQHDYRILKLFPAAASGGIALLKSLRGPFPDVLFCPTGGLAPDNFRDYLAQPNVVCCGGSWMVTGELVGGGRWDDIEALARDAIA